MKEISYLFLKLLYFPNNEYIFNFHNMLSDFKYSNFLKFTKKTELPKNN